MKRDWAWWLAIFFLAVFVYRTVVRELTYPLLPLPDVPGGMYGLTLFLMLSSFFHAWYTLGWRHTLILFVLSAAISWGYEQVGVGTGLIYGSYYYTDRLGPKLGHVPLLIPLAWFMMNYPSYIMANLIADGRPLSDQGHARGGVGRIIWLSFLGAMIMTAWDLVVDPMFSGPQINAWVWKLGGPYFGIPAQNYAGWLLTTFTVFLLYRLIEHKLPERPTSPVTTLVAALPLMIYGSQMLANTIHGTPEAMRVIAPFVMGLPLIIAFDQLFKFSTG